MNEEFERTDDAADIGAIAIAVLLLALVLTVVTGIVDGIGFTRLFHVFPANQTGNLVLLGISIGDPQLAEWWRPATAMVSFALGVAIASLVGRNLGVRTRRGVLLTFEVVLLAGVALIAGDVRPLDPGIAGVRLLVVLVLAGSAMGLQTIVIGRVAGISMSTTFETEAIVRLTRTTVGLDQRRQGRIRTMTVLAAVLVSYAGGAAIGSAVARWWGGILWVPVAVTAITAGATLWWSRRRLDPPHL